MIKKKISNFSQLLVCFVFLFFWRSVFGDSLYQRNELFQFDTKGRDYYSGYRYVSFGWDGNKNFYLFDSTDRILTIVDEKGNLIRELNLKTSTDARVLSVDSNGDFVCYPYSSGGGGGSYVFDAQGQLLNIFEGGSSRESGRLVINNGIVFEERTGNILAQIHGPVDLPQKTFLKDIQTLGNGDEKQLKFVNSNQSFPVSEFGKWFFNEVVGVDFQNNIYARYEKDDPDPNDITGFGSLKSYRLYKFDSRMRYQFDFEDDAEFDPQNQNVYFLDNDPKTGRIKMVEYKYNGGTK